MRMFEIAGAALMLLLAACGPSAEPAAETNAGSEASAPMADAPRRTVLPVGAADEGAANAAAATPEREAPRLTPEAERGETGARDLLLDFVRAIERKEFAQAWSLMSPADKAKWSRAQFAALFDGLGEITVAVPSGTMEGAAGSLYYSAPVAITADGKDGRPVRIEGKAILRRVNDVDGSTEAQRRWHFHTLELDWTH